MALWFKRLSMTLWDQGKRYHWTHDHTGTMIFHTTKMEECEEPHFNKKGQLEE